MERQNVERAAMALNALNPGAATWGDLKKAVEAIAAVPTEMDDVEVTMEKALKVRQVLADRIALITASGMDPRDRQSAIADVNDRAREVLRETEGWPTLRGSSE